MQNAKHLLGSDSFWMVNKKLTRKLSDVCSTILLTYLIDKEDYHATRNELITIDGDKYFYATAEKMHKATTITYRQQKRCLKLLSSHKFIKQKLIGIPAKLHFSICHNQICAFMISSIDKSAKLELTKSKNTDLHNVNTVCDKSAKPELTKRNDILITEDKEQIINNRREKQNMGKIHFFPAPF